MGGCLLCLSLRLSASCKLGLPHHLPTQHLPGQVFVRRLSLRLVQFRVTVALSFGYLAGRVWCCTLRAAILAYPPTCKCNCGVKSATVDT